MVSVRINCEMTHRDEEWIVLWHLRQDETALDKRQVSVANGGKEKKYGGKMSSSIQLQLWLSLCKLASVSNRYSLIKIRK